MHRQPAPSVWPGKPYPLGATVTDEGINFAIFSQNATGVELCLFDSADTGKAKKRFKLKEYTDGVWHGFVPGLKSGQYYGYRVEGPYDPAHGHRFNKHKLVLDPYAKVIAGLMNWAPEVYPYKLGGKKEDFVRDVRDSAAFMPKSQAYREDFPWEGDQRPETPWEQTVIYEVHVKGFTQLCTQLPEEIRGTYAGLASDVAIDYLKNLGVTAVELLPVQTFFNDHYLEDKGLTNYWGYSTVGYFSPQRCYAINHDPVQAVREFKGMVKRLHTAGLEVILDVVYNHTAEGNHLGPMLSFRGIDNASYYRLSPADRRFYMDYTGCGNSMDMHHPRSLQMVTDSLRYWVEEMHVDGFRFDLASTLGRQHGPVDKYAAFFTILNQDPVLSRVKLIAEPWDVGEGGYQVGNFPALWSEWNGMYRDNVRSFWKEGEAGASELAERLAGSAGMFRHEGRRPRASINFITAHDGFTLHDLVSYNDKHNDANGEDNRDGDNNNHSWNCGAEGPTEDQGVLALRRKQMRNMLATLMLSQGVPMLSGGDEIARTQRGNNNAYCQDNEISWHSWSHTHDQVRQLKFVSQLIAFRKEHPQFHRRDFFDGRSTSGTGFKEIVWIKPEGMEMSAEDWQHGIVRCVGMLLNGKAMTLTDDHGRPLRDSTFLLLFNAFHEPIPFTLPTWDIGGDKPWKIIMDTNDEEGFRENPQPQEIDSYDLQARSMVILEWILEP